MPLKTKPRSEADKFTPLVVNAVLKGIVAEKPAGFVYEDHEGRKADVSTSCHYTNPDGTPSCLVGQVMHRLNVPRPEFDNYQNKGSNALGLNVLRDYFTAPAIARLQKVQARQDQGETWARAIR